MYMFKIYAKMNNGDSWPIHLSLFLVLEGQQFNPHHGGTKYFILKRMSCWLPQLIDSVYITNMTVKGAICQRLFLANLCLLLNYLTLVFGFNLNSCLNQQSVHIPIKLVKENRLLNRHKAVHTDKECRPCWKWHDMMLALVLVPL